MYFSTEVSKHATYEIILVQQPVSSMQHLKKLWPIGQFLCINKAHFKHTGLVFLYWTHRFALPDYLAKIKVSFLLKIAVSCGSSLAWFGMFWLLYSPFLDFWWMVIFQPLFSWLSFLLTLYPIQFHYSVLTGKSASSLTTDCWLVEFLLPLNFELPL